MVTPSSEFDPDERELCPDGVCTGVLGDDGVCGTCGQRGALPAQRSRGTRPDADAAEAPPFGAGDEVDGVNPFAVDDEAAGEFDPDARVPCPDGVCVGIMGPDGSCGVCGRRA